MKTDALIDALQHLKVETGSLACLGCGHEHSCSTRGCAIIREAVDLIKKQQTRKDPEPLTLGELRGMIGEPVWVVPLNGGCYWAIASESLLSLYAGYLAYRSKPEEEQP